jgi:hypothetical protein
MKSVTEVQVMVKGTCKCCGSPFQEIVSIATGSSTDLQVPAPKTMTAAIIGAVAQATGIPEGRILSNSREVDVTLARHLCVWVLKNFLGLSASAFSSSSIPLASQTLGMTGLRKSHANRSK